MLESLKHEDLQFQELSPEEKQNRGILARLTGPIASFTKGTRNGRKYSDKLWEQAFEAPLVKEMFKNGGLPGELQHPADRSETDPTKIAIMMPEPPKKDSKGHLVASVDILDTPCGQIAYQLGKYGFKFGISSRGEGDLITDFNGEESVDPDTYTLNAFDLVLIPACEDARLQFNESLETKPTNKLRAILNEALENASAADRKIMEEALDELDFSDNYQFVETYNGEDIYFDPEEKKYIVGYADSYTVLNSLKNAKAYIDRFNSDVLTEEQVGREETKDAEDPSELLQNKPQEKPEEPATEKEVKVTIDSNGNKVETEEDKEQDDKEFVKEINEEDVDAADNDGAIVEQLQNILKLNKSLEAKIKDLQEKISVGYAKELELTEELDSYKERISKLSKKSKEVKVLTEKLAKANDLLEKTKAEAEGNVSKLNESIASKDTVANQLKKDKIVLQESIEKKNTKIKSLSEQISQYKELVESKESDIKELEEKYAEGRKDLEQVKSNYTKKLEQQNQIIEKYQRVAKNSVKRYIESQAVRLGVKSDEIMNRLPKNYSFNDIDRICEDLQEYKFNMSNLPFSQSVLNENLTVTAKNVNKGITKNINPEDEITDYDLKIAEAFL